MAIGNSLIGHQFPIFLSLIFVNYSNYLDYNFLNYLQDSDVQHFPQFDVGRAGHDLRHRLAQLQLGEHGLPLDGASRGRRSHASAARPQEASGGSGGAAEPHQPLLGLQASRRGETGAADAHAAAAAFDEPRRVPGRQLQHADVRSRGPLHDDLEAARPELRPYEAGHVVAVALCALARGHVDDGEREHRRRREQDHRGRLSQQHDLEQRPQAGAAKTKSAILPGEQPAEAKLCQRVPEPGMNSSVETIGF